VRAIALLSFFVIVLFSTAAFAQLQVYSVNTVLDEKGRSFVKLVITFPGAEETFNFTIKGNVENLNASSNAGPVSCELTSGLITPVHCSLNLTKEKRTVYIDYETPSFVKISDKHFFYGDFSLGKSIDSMVVFLTLPEGMVPVKEMESTFPPNATASWDLSGRKLTLTWSLSNLTADRSLIFQVLYENMQPSAVSKAIWYIIPLVIISVVLITLFIVRRMKKSREVVLSVLDGFERKVMDVIIASGGTVNQRKVVQETNLSKAKVSRVVKSLEERGLIEVERLGRTNRLKARKKILEWIK
jgi:uncharacterized membrane protein